MATLNTDEIGSNDRLSSPRVIFPTTNKLVAGADRTRRRLKEKREEDEYEEDEEEGPREYSSDSERDQLMGRKDGGDGRERDKSVVMRRRRKSQSFPSHTDRSIFK